MSTSVLLGSTNNQYLGVHSDSVSVAHGTGIDICGARSFTVSSTKNSAASSLSSTTDLFINTYGTVLLQTSTSTTIGTHTASVTVSLLNYPLVVLT